MTEGFIIMLLAIIFTMFICGCISGAIYNRTLGFFLGVFFGPIGIIIAAILSLDPEYKLAIKNANVESQRNKKELDLAKWDEDMNRLYLAGVAASQENIKKENKKIDAYWKQLKQSGKAW